MVDYISFFAGVLIVVLFVIIAVIFSVSIIFSVVGDYFIFFVVIIVFGGTQQFYLRPELLLPLLKRRMVVPDGIHLSGFQRAQSAIWSCRAPAFVASFASPKFPLLLLPV